MSRTEGKRPLPSTWEASTTPKIPTGHVGLTPDQIIETALRLMDQHGVEWLTMRRLADALGVRAPTLYWHIASKQELHDSCVQRTLERISLPEASQDDWRRQVRAFMTTMRDQIRLHPSVIDLMRYSTPPAMARMSTQALRLMKAAGLDWEQAYLYCRLMIWRVIGFTGMENTLRRGSYVHQVDAEQPRGAPPTRYHVVEQWPADAPPQARALSTKVDLDEMYQADVEVFIQGIEAIRADNRKRKVSIPPLDGHLI